MIRSLVASSLSFRLLVIPVAAAIAIVGVLELRDTPADLLPEFAPPYVEIQTEALGLSATEVEQLITVPMERDLLNGVAGIDVIRSESVLGLSRIVLVFTPGTDLLSARQLVQERLTQAHILPNVAKPPLMLQPLSSESRVLMIGLSSRQLSLIELGLLARWTIRPRLLGIPGVANVVIWGQREHQLQVQVDPERLRRRGVSLQQVVRTTGNAQLVSPLSFLEASTPGTGGFIDTPNQRLQVRHVLPIAEPEGLAQVPLEAEGGERAPVAGGNAVRLGDVADVVVAHQPLIGDAVVNGRPGLQLVVEKFPGANTLEVTREVEDALAAMRPGLAGVELDADVFRPASFIEEAVDNVALALLIGGLLIGVVLVASFLDWRAALVGLASLPLSLVTAMLVLDLLGETMNALVLTGLLLALGVLVDDVIIGVESVRRGLRGSREDESGRPRATLVLEATLEARGPVTFATLIVLVAALPVLVLPGRLGDFFQPLAVSFALAVLASAVFAVTVTPALAVILLREDGVGRREPPLLRLLTSRYTAVLRRVVATPGTVLVVAAAVVVAGMLLVPFLGHSAIPSFKERELLISLEGAPGASRAAMVRVASQMGRELRSTSGVRDVGAHVGRAVMGDRIVGAGSADLWVSLDSDADYEATVRRVDEVVAGYPGVEPELVTYSTDRIRAIGAVADGKADDDDRADRLGALTAEDEPLVVRIYGKELDVLQRKANEVREAIGGVDGVVDPRVERRLVEPALEIEPRLAAARRHGIKPGDIRRAAATLVQGIEVGSLFEEQKVFDVVVVGVPELGHSLTSLRRLLIDKPDGGQVPLADVADVLVAPTPTVIEREAASRRVDVTADVRGRDLGAVTDEVERVLESVRFPLEYHAEVLGESGRRRAADLRAQGFALAAAIAIVLFLQAAFGSWRLTLVVFAGLPLALAGGVLAALAVDGGDLSLGALAGLGAVFAIASRNGLALIGRYQVLRADEEFGRDLVMRGASERLWPVALTALATAAAVAPFLVRGEVAGHEIAHPFAAVVLGGLVTSTVFTLVLVPAAYLRFGSGAELADDAFVVDDARRASAAQPVNRPT